MKIHFIGIGGIGVSALARYYLEKGYRITGSDLVSSEITDSLKKAGAEIYIGHRANNLKPGTDLLIYSPAVPKDNPELKKARKLKIKCQSYPQALGDLTKKYFTIAISGTHGKSTTAAMAGFLLTKAGFNPTVILGTKLKEFGNSNFRSGDLKYLVIEADEWRASFLNYWPKIIILTNIEREHLDYYKNLKRILKTYREYLSHLPEDGILIANKDDQNIMKISRNLSFGNKKRVVFFSLKQPEAKKIKKILKIPGEHNIANALAVLTLARILKIPDQISLPALSQYKGSWRRFERKKINLPKSPSKKSSRRIELISDYAHHPTEIKMTLKAAREKYPKKKIWLIYQPHQYQRTFYLFNDFVKVFREAPIEKLIITDVYDVAGREKKKIKKKVGAKKLVEKIKRPSAIYLPKEKIINYLKENLDGQEVVIIMGAGDIYQLAENF